MLSRWNTFAGKRYPLVPKKTNYVELFAWFHPLYAPAYHLAVKVTKGDEVAYLSIAPLSYPSFSKTSLFGLSKGFPAYFIKCYEDELLIQGFRKEWASIKNKLSEEQKLLILRQENTLTTTLPLTLKKISDELIFIIADLFSAAIKNALRLKGTPMQTVRFNSLNVGAIFAKIQTLKSPQMNTKWALWSGTHFQEENTFNCASSALLVLSAGGMNGLLQSNHAFLYSAAVLISASVTYFRQESWQKAFINIVLAVLCLRGIRGGIEGYTHIQSYLNYNVMKGKTNRFEAVGFRLLSTVLASFIGMLTDAPLVPTVIAMPAEVLALAQQAKIEEENRYARHQYDCQKVLKMAPKNSLAL